VRLKYPKSIKCGVIKIASSNKNVPPAASQAAFLSLQRQVGSATVGDETDWDILRIRRPLLYAIVSRFQEKHASGGTNHRTWHFDAVATAATIC
jgi:hypothetical protein